MYCSLADLIARFGAEEITAAADRDRDGTPDDDVIAAACADAAAEIDVRLAARYRVPLEEPQPIIRTLACDVARYRLLEGRPHEQAVERYKAAIGLLDGIAQGTLTLGGGDETVARLRIDADASLFPADAQADFTGGVR